jgi:hypothetical protein
LLISAQLWSVATTLGNNLTKHINAESVGECRAPGLANAFSVRLFFFFSDPRVEATLGCD